MSLEDLADQTYQSMMSMAYEDDLRDEQLVQLDSDPNHALRNRLLKKMGENPIDKIETKIKQTQKPAPGLVHGVLDDDSQIGKKSKDNFRIILNTMF